MLISGCDSGFGQLLTVALDAAGYRVLAGCLTADGIKALQATCSERVIPFSLDITSASSVQSAVSLVQQHGGGRLHALVNNAGTTSSSVVDLTTMEEYSRVMDVNYLGHVRMTKSLLPALLPRRRGERGGRVVTMTSASGIIGGPGQSPYVASKHALEGFTDCFRREMGAHTDWRLDVSLLEPGFMRTPLVTGYASSASANWELRDPAGRERWGRAAFDETVRQKLAAMRTMDDPAVVVQAYMHAVTAEHPCIRYHPGRFSFLIYLLSLLPYALVDRLLSMKLRVLPTYLTR